MVVELPRWDIRLPYWQIAETAPRQQVLWLDEVFLLPTFLEEDAVIERYLKAIRTFRTDRFAYEGFTRQIVQETEVFLVDLDMNPARYGLDRSAVPPRSQRITLIWMQACLMEIDKKEKEADRLYQQAYDQACKAHERELAQAISHARFLFQERWYDRLCAQRLTGWFWTLRRALTRHPDPYYPDEQLA